MVEDSKKSVAGEAGVPFLYTSGSQFDEMFVGVGAKRVNILFEVRSMSLIVVKIEKNNTKVKGSA